MSGFGRIISTDVYQIESSELMCIKLNHVMITEPMPALDTHPTGGAD